MRTEVFKTEAEYEEWEAKKGNCIFCITDYTEDGSEGEFICDMIEDDFYELSDEKVGLINPEGYYYLLKPLTDKQKELLKENHGIRIIIIEEDFALSDEQKKVVENFKNAFKKLKDSNIKLVWDEWNQCGYAVNTERAAKVNSSYFEDEMPGSIDISDAMVDIDLTFDVHVTQEDSLLCTLK